MYYKIKWISTVFLYLSYFLQVCEYTEYIFKYCLLWEILSDSVILSPLKDPSLSG